MIHLSALLKHYKRAEIQKAMLDNSKQKEIAVRFGDKGFGKRPDVLKYPRDVLELAKQGATSFHSSEEMWSNPMQLNPSMRPAELDALRTGWDLVLDIDCHFLEYSKVAADIVVKALKHHGVESVSIKFSGNKGFHIGVPFEAFPDRINNQETRLMFPDAPRRIAAYIKEMIRNPLSRAIMDLENGDIAHIKEKTGKKISEITRHVTNEFGDNVGVLDVEPFLDIDTILISSRHLYRMPYSFHEKSGLISLPFNPDKVMNFKKKYASPENIKVSKHVFLDRANARNKDATKLIVQAFDFSAKHEERQEEKKYKDVETLESAIPEEFFPPCIKNIFKGLPDGRKRTMFILVNFLTSCGWDYDTISARLKQWNKKNREQLKEVSLVGQIRYHKQQKKKILPPNCDNKMYYKGFGVCIPDSLCQRVRNPVNYAKRKTRYLNKKGGKVAKGRQD